MKTQTKSCGDVLASIREYYENKPREEKYSEAGYLLKPDILPMRDGGWPGHNPYDLPAEVSDWRDNPPE